MIKNGEFKDISKLNSSMEILSAAWNEASKDIYSSGGGTDPLQGAADIFGDAFKGKDGGN